MAFQSYCWSLGTTSFRVQNLNYKIERQLQLLNVLWSDKSNIGWNEITQEKYYNIMHEAGLLIGEAQRKSKDARQKTSGLVEIGVIDKDRKITNIGNKIISIINSEDFDDDNIFNIHKDSFIYLKQLLKMQKVGTNMEVKPFIVLIYLLTNLKYLTREEFTYLLPLCIKNADAKSMAYIIEKLRNNETTIEDIIYSKMSAMDNYIEALEYMNTNPMDTLEKFAKVDMNRKSKEYSKPIYQFYINLWNIIQGELDEEKTDKLMEFIRSKACKRYWKEYLGYKVGNEHTEEWKEYLKNTKLFKSKDITEYNTEFFRVMHTAKWMANLEDYADLNRRYISLTDIVLFNDNKIELDILPKYYFLNISEELLNTRFLKSKEYDVFIENDIEFSEIYNCLNIDINEIITQIKVDYPDSKISISNVKEFIKDERFKRFELLMESKFKKENLIMLFRNIERDNRKEIEEYLDCEATIPTILEYVLAIAWYRISNKQGNILDFMKLSLDANLLPKNHAGGGTADIVYHYNKSENYNEHDLLLEATLTDSTSQRKAEMEPVSRHLIRNKQEFDNDTSYAVFVANILNSEVLSDFRSRKNYWYKGKNDEDKQGLKIIPLSINDVVEILEKNLNYVQLYNMFENAYNDTKINDLRWYDTLIKEGIKNI